MNNSNLGYNLGIVVKYFETMLDFNSRLTGITSWGTGCSTNILEFLAKQCIKSEQAKLKTLNGL